MNFGARLRQERRRRHLSQEALAEKLGISTKSISRWEQEQSIPQGHAQLQLSRFFDLPVEELFEDNKAQGHPIFLWNVPYSRNPFFTGREEILHRLHKHLNQKQILALTQPVSVNGLGGIGKTQVALEYAYQYRQNYRFIFWTNGATRETLMADIITIAELLQLPERGEQDPQKILQAVKQWFATQQEWLWILDNIDDVKMVSNVVPTEHHGHLLLTSRAQAMGMLAQRIDIEIMDMVEAVLFLLRRAKLLAPATFLDQVPEDHLAAAEAIALEMDFLPLALDQAGAYVEEVGCSLSEYLKLYRTHRKELLQHRGHVPTYHPESVVTTWSLSFQKIEQAHPAATALLQLCAYLDPDAIPEELISEGSACLGPTLSLAAMDAFKLNAAIEELRKFSLIQRYPETRTLRIHRLVQSVLRDTMEIEDQRQWAERVVRATNIVFPESVEMTTWSRCRHYLSQAQACSVLIRNYTLTFEEGASLLSRTASYLQVYTLYKQAESLLQEALHIRKQILGPDHPRVAIAHRNLAHLYREQRDYAQAESLFLHTLRIQEQALGPDHPEIISTLQGLADVYRSQERNGQAESLYQRALCIWERAGEQEYLKGAPLFNGLALIRCRQGKYNEAVALSKRALHMLEQALGPDHTDIAPLLNNLGFIYYRQEKHSDTGQLYRRAISIMEQALGPDHPRLTLLISNLAESLYYQKKYCEAEALYRQALHLAESSYGTEHLSVAYPLGGLANVYLQQGMHTKAEPLYLRALRLRELHQGALHPETAELLLDLAAFREAQGYYQEAISVYERVLSIQRQGLGPTHPEIATTLSRYSTLLRTLGLSDDTDAVRRQI